MTECVGHEGRCSSRSAEAYIPDKIRNAYSVTVQFSRKITSKWNRLISITFAIKGHKRVQENWWGQFVINLLPYNMIFRWINLSNGNRLSFKSLDFFL